MVLHWTNGIRENYTIDKTMKKTCLPLLVITRYCQTKTKNPVKTGCYDDSLLVFTGRCQTSIHSHSIVAGGLPEMS
jgi:hypothetical protein